MKQRTLKLTALALALLMLASCLLILTPSAQPAEYSSQANSGKRDELCLSLDGTGAADYYTGNYTFDYLVTLSPSSLQSALNTLMKSTHKNITSYNDCRDLVFRVDCEQGDTSHATTLYTDYSMTASDWSPAWNCNREHVWPQSLGGGNTSGGGADLHHIRPAEKGVNSSRGNKPYGETTSKGYYEPADHVKGDVARIILYVYVRWNSEWGATDVTEVFESVDILLAWCELDPVDTWEMGRNEVVEDIQGNRNTFIDYPELAWMIFGREVPDGMVTPSGSALNGEIPTQPTEPETETPDEPESETAIPETPAGQLAVFDFGANGGAAHSDGTDITSAKTYTDGDYSLTITSPVKLYGGARDAKGNSCLKVGSSKAVGSFTFTVPSDVDEVVIHAAGYKANNATVSVNGKQHSVNTCSNDGVYTPITVDTTSTKTVTVSTISGATRCMINTVEFRTNIVEPEITEPVTTEPVTEPVTEPETETDPVTEPETEPETEIETTAPVTEAPTEPEVTTEEPAETPTEPEVTTEEPTTEEPTVEEPTTEEPTVEEPTTDEPTSEETTEAEPVVTEPTATETQPDTESATATEVDGTTTPAEEGCGATLAGGVMISMLFVGVFAYARRKRED